MKKSFFEKVEDLWKEVEDIKEYIEEVI